MNKVFVIGIDSATFDVIEPLMKQGELPNILKLVKNGCSGPLRSTFPPVTPPAWVSFMTGKNPGKHGVFDFFAPPSHGYERPVLNANYIKSQTLWKILSDMGKTVGAINVPITYPPEKINGFIIPGIQYGLDETGSFTYPPELIGEINDKVGKYEVAYGNLMGVYSHELDAYIQRWKEIHENREKTVLYLMDKYNWDFFMAVFYSVDAIQHRFWQYFDKTHPFYDEKGATKYSSVIPDFYKMIDRSIGKILDKLGNKGHVVVVSDHGMGPEHKAFYLNTWLLREGLLSVKKELYPFIWLKPPHIVFKILNKLRYKAIAWTIPMKLYNILKNSVDPRDGLKTTYFIKWSKTRAYAANYTEQGVYINLKGREPEGVVEPGAEYENIRDKIIDKLREITDPGSGEKLFDAVFKKEEVYHGPYIENAPDIFFLIKGATVLSHPTLYHKDLFGVDFRNSATHRLNGIFIANGNGIEQNKHVNSSNIMDLAPTILHLLKLPVPTDMDGHVLEDIFTSKYKTENPINFTNISTDKSDSSNSGVFSGNESEDIKEKLRDLGYV